MRIQIHAGRGPQPAVDAMPPGLVRLSPSGELVLVELQGSLEMDGMDPAGGQTIGVLRFPEGHEDRPVLQISHHRLEGAVVDLTRPIAVLEKRVTPTDKEEESEIEDASPPSSPGPSSPTQSAKRARLDPPRTPVKQSGAPSSSPMPERVARFSDGHLDFSSPQSGRVRPATSTSYHVVTIVRKKLLFSKRPEPIVRLDT